MMMNLQQASAEGLSIAQRNLIKTEPPNHNPLECSNPQACAVCIAWRAWARELVLVNREIVARETK